MAGPIDTKGRYEGGITYIIKALQRKAEEFQRSGIALSWFDNCRITRQKKTEGKLCLENFRNAWLVQKMLLERVQQEKPELLYYHSSIGFGLLKDLVAVRAVKKKHPQIRTAVHIHFAELEKILPSNRLLRGWALRLLKESVDCTVFLSEATRQEFIAQGLQEGKTTTVYNFHQLDVPAEDIAQKCRASEKREELRMVFLGSIDVRKGILDLMKVLQDVDIPWRLDICGMPTDADTEAVFRQRLAAETRGRFCYHGYVRGDEKRDILLGSDVLVLPSYGEGFPIVLLEGMAAGCAVITTHVGVIPEVFSDENGAVIHPGDAQELKAAIGRLSSKAVRVPIMQNNYELSRKYTLSGFVQVLLNLLLPLE